MNWSRNTIPTPSCSEWITIRGKRIGHEAKNLPRKKTKYTICRACHFFLRRMGVVSSSRLVQTILSTCERDCHHKSDARLAVPDSNAAKRSRCGERIRFCTIWHCHFSTTLFGIMGAKSAERLNRLLALLRWWRQWCINYESNHVPYGFLNDELWFGFRLGWFPATKLGEDNENWCSMM